jgi:hypothetical protein
MASITIRAEGCDTSYENHEEEAEPASPRIGRSSGRPADMTGETPRIPRDTRHSPRAYDAPSSGLMSGHLYGHALAESVAAPIDGLQVSGAPPAYGHSSNSMFGPRWYRRQLKTKRTKRIHFIMDRIPTAELCQTPAGFTEMVSASFRGV